MEIPIDQLWTYPAVMNKNVPQSYTADINTG